MHAQVSDQGSEVLHGIPRPARADRADRGRPPRGASAASRRAFASASCANTTSAWARKISRSAPPQTWRRWRCVTWRWAAAPRAPGRGARRRYSTRIPQRDGFDSPHTIVLVVTDDMPFLVDSLNVVFNQAEVAVHLIVHPVLSVKRDGRGRLVDVAAAPKDGARSESWQLFKVDLPGRSGPARAPAGTRSKPRSPTCAWRLQDWHADAQAHAHAHRRAAERSAAACRRTKWPRRAICSTGWKAGISSSWATAITASSAARAKTG